MSLVLVHVCRWRHIRQRSCTLVSPVLSNIRHFAKVALWRDRRDSGNEFSTTYKSRESILLDKKLRRNTNEQKKLIAEIRDCGKSHLWLQALELLRNRLCPGNRGIYGAALEALIRARRFQTAVDFFHRMPLEFKDEIAFTTLINFCAREKQLSMAEDLFEDMQKPPHSLEPTVITYTALLTAYSMCALWEPAVQRLNEYLSQGIRAHTAQQWEITFNVAMSACARAGKYTAARGLLEIAEREYSMVPNAAHFNTLMAACISTGDAVQARKLWKEMFDRGIRYRCEDYNTILRVFRRDLESCRVFADEMNRNGVGMNADTYSALITAHLNSGDRDGALQKIEEMERSGVPSNAASRSVVKLAQKQKK